MPPLLIWTRRFLLVALVLAALVAAGVYGGSALVRARVWDDIPPTRMGVLPTDASSVAEGGRLARLLGCYDCHGTRLEGRLFFSERRVAELVAPNLTRIVPSYSNDELARAIRHGVRRDGTGLFAMPSSSFYHLSDEDLGRLMAYLRRQPPADGYEGTTSVGPIGHVGIVTGRFRLVPATMDHRAARIPASPGGAEAARGRYLAHVACSECHGAAFEGGLEGRAPPLAIASTYTDDAFRHLLRTGETPGKRPLYLMSATARARFAHLTDDEIAALLTFARTLR